MKLFSLWPWIVPHRRPCIWLHISFPEVADTPLLHTSLINTFWQKNLFLPKFFFYFFFLESSETYAKKFHKNQSNNYFLLRFWFKKMFIRFRLFLKEKNYWIFFRKFISSDFFFMFLESSETYADPSLNEIGAKLFFFSRKILGKSQEPKMKKKC